VLFQELLGLGIGPVDESLNLGINPLSGLFAVILVLNDLTTQKNMVVLSPKSHGPQVVAHAPLTNHLAGYFGGPLNIVACARGLLIKYDLFRHPTGKKHDQVVLQKSPAVGVTIVGQLHGHAQGHTSRNDGNLMHRIRAGQQLGHQGVPRLVVGRGLSFLFAEDHAATFLAHQNFVLSLLEISHLHLVLALPGRVQGRLVD